MSILGHSYAWINFFQSSTYRTFSYSVLDAYELVRLFESLPNITSKWVPTMINLIFFSYIYWMKNLRAITYYFDIFYTIFKQTITKLIPFPVLLCEFEMHPKPRLFINYTALAYLSIGFKCSLLMKLKLGS